MASSAAAEADAALYSFGCVMLALYLVPGALFALWRVARSPRALVTSRGLAIHVALLALAAAAFWRCLQQLQASSADLGVFDPYEILGVADSASQRDIRRAFRALGRQLHPDKNLQATRAAAAQFSRVTKAYEALTDPAAMENYRKFGHPDGRQALSMQFAFASAFGLGDGATGGSLVVAVYFAVVIGGVAFAVYRLHKQSARRDRTQVSRRTMAVFDDALQDKMSVHDVVELLLATDEMTGASSSNTREQEERELAAQRAKAHDKVLKKMEAARALPGDAVSRIKKHPDPVARENMIALYSYLRRSKLQGVPKPVWGECVFSIRYGPSALTGGCCGWRAQWTSASPACCSRCRSSSTFSRASRRSSRSSARTRHSRSCARCRCCRRSRRAIWWPTRRRYESRQRVSLPPLLRMERRSP